MYLATIKKRILPLLLATLCITGAISDAAAFAQPLSPESISQNELPDSQVSEPVVDVEEETNIKTEEPSAPAQPDSISDNTLCEEEEILPEADPADSDSCVIRFYMGEVSESKLFLQVTMPKGHELSEYLDDIQQLSPVRNGYKFGTWTNPANGKVYSKAKTLYNKIYPETSTPDVLSYTYIGAFSTTPYKFSIEYNLNSGAFTEETDAPASFTVESENITLPAPIRKDYTFGGWYQDAALTQAVTSIPKGTFIDSDDVGYVAPLSLYAKWDKVKPATPSISSLKNPSTGKVTIKIKKLSKADGYEFMMSTDKKFKKNTNKVDVGSKTSYTLTNMPKGKTYYFKVRAYQKDSTGKKCYGDYSKVKSIKIKKGVKEYPAKKDSAKLKKVKVANHTDLEVKATVAKRIKSSDDSYYLVKVDPVTGKVSKKIAQSPKIKDVVFAVPLRDEKGTNLIQGRFAIAIKSGKKYKLISSASYIDNPQDAAAYTAAFPKAASKKGIQGNLNTAMGNHQTYLNILVNQMIAQKGSGTPYQYNGKTYYFYDPYHGFISEANAKGMTVTGQIMIQWYTADTNKLILKSGRSGGHAYYALDAQTKSSREELEALFCFMAEQWSQENCHLDNWIIGNEVNIHKIWFYAGNISEDTFMKNYADTFRILYYAVKGSSKNSRVYICTDHTWNNRQGDWGARPFIELFNKKIKAQNKNIQWNLAYHAYPSVLTNAKVWDDNADPRFTTANSLASDFVTPYNLNVLTDFIKKNYGSKTRIILSEQGFTAYTGENVQAAALAYSYYKAEFNDMIDSFLLHDAPINTQEDYSLTNSKGQKRPAYDVFIYMNSPSYEKYTQSCLKTIGISSWKEVIKGFDANKLKNMPAH